MASDDLPEDVTIDILSRLPVKSLMRFKCVCKSLCSLIESPSFISEHLNHSPLINDNNGNGTLLVRRRFDKEDKFFLLSGKKFDVSTKLDLPYFKEDFHLQLEMVGSCNGIICLRHRKRIDLALWNPATKEFRALPESHVPLPPGTVLAGVYHYDVGFGFDVKTNDYKVVKLVYLKSNDRPWANNHVEVYSLSTDSWSLVDVVMPPMYIIPVGSYKAYLNGIYCWWGKYHDKLDQIMISFDMSDEMFQATPLPDVCAVNHLKSFVVLNESIALVLFPGTYPDRLPQCFEIWVLNKYGVKESWAKLYTIGPILGNGFPIGFSKSGDFFLGKFNGQLVLCDPVTQEIKKFHVIGGGKSLQVLFYDESLVSVKGGIDAARMTIG